MDAFHQSRLLPRPPTAADPSAPPQFWPPPAPGPPGAYHPPPPPPQWNHSGDAYQYPHQPPPPYPQQQPPPLQNPPPYPPPGGGYHGQPYGPPPPLRYPPPPLHYPPPNQAWGSSTWAQHQGWDYPERNALYNNDNDWAARAKAWADNKPAEYHQTPSQFTSLGRTDDHKFAYHDPNQQGVGPSMDAQGSFPQSSNQQLPDFRTQDNLHAMTSYSSGLSYHTDGHLIRNVGVETMASTAHMSSPQKGHGPGSSIYEQEVPYIYSSSTGNREAGDYMENSHFQLPLPLSSDKGLHMRTALSAEQPRYAHAGQSYKPLIDPSDLPLEFEPRSGSGNESHQSSSYGHSDPSGPAGAIVGDAIATSIHAWNSSSAPGTVFSQLPLSSTGTQFDTSYVSQSSLPLHTIPPFVGVSGSNFRSPIPPTSAPFSLATGAPVHALAFSGDGNGNGAFNLSERPKKAAVPNWLREEIIKNKTVISSTIASHAAESSFHSVGSEDDDKSYRIANQSDNKSIESAKSTEDEEDDEDNLEAARSMAINQEIKRVLTEVLLKVTDELFDEIATKVLNEDDISVEVDENAATGNQKASSLPLAIKTPKTSAKVLVQVKKNGLDFDGASDNSRRSSPKGDILGLANYASDDDETESSGIVVDSSHRQESNARHPENTLKDVDTGNASLNSHRPSHGSHVMESERNKPDAAGKPWSSSTKSKEANITVGNASHSTDSLQYHGKSPKEVLQIREGRNSVDRGKAVDVPVQNAIPSEPKGKILESTLRTSNNGKLDTEVHEERSEMKRKMDTRDYPKERFQDRGGRKDVDERDLDSRSSSKHGRSKDENKETSRDKREKDRKEDGRKKEQTRDGKEDRSARVMKDSLRYSSIRSPSPSNRDRKSKQKSSGGHGSASSGEPSDNLKKRKLSSDRRNSSPSPPRSTKRQVSRSPHSKRSHRRHSPYSSTDKRRRSRSRSPVRHRSANKHDK